MEINDDFYWRVAAELHKGETLNYISPSSEARVTITVGDDVLLDCEVSGGDSVYLIVRKSEGESEPRLLASEIQV